jgi:capsular polysaccharide biosynthesis protein
VSVIEEFELTVVAYPNGIVVPTEVDRVNKTFTGGVYDESGHLVDNSLRQDKEHLGVQAFPQLSPSMINDIKVQHVLKGRYLYLGFYTEHYGHFLLETLSRLWAYTENKYDGVVFNEFVIPRQTQGISSFSQLFFAPFGIKASSVSIVNVTTQFEWLDVPNPQFFILNKADIDYIDTYRKISDFYIPSKKDESLRIYVSRSKLLKRKRKVLNEAAIEKVFISHGFIVIHPQELSFLEQLALLSNTHVLAGMEGSGLHNCVFMPPGGTVINLCGVRQPNSIKSNQKICDALAHLTGLVLPFVGEVVNKVKLITRYDIPHIKQWLRKNISRV